MADPAVTDIKKAALTLAAETHRLSERVEYLHVAVMRGDPRFSAKKYSKPDFDCVAFDKAWEARGKRVPSLQEVFG